MARPTRLGDLAAARLLGLGLCLPSRGEAGDAIDDDLEAHARLRAVLGVNLGRERPTD